MVALTRSEALFYARIELVRLAQRAAEMDEGSREYVSRLRDSWAETLTEIANPADDPSITGEAWRVLDRLIRTINDRSLTASALVEWVDAFPEAVADLLADEVQAALPVGAMKVSMPPTKAVAKAGNNQSTLALAA